MTVSAGNELMAEQRRLAAVSSVAAVVARHVDNLVQPPRRPFATSKVRCAGENSIGRMLDASGCCGRCIAAVRDENWCSKGKD